MKTIFTTILLFSALSLGIVTPSFSQSSEQLFQKGMIKEEGEGKLNEAIDIYLKIAENEDAEESLKAKALLRAGQCYEKQGRNEATKTYQRLVNNFPNQKSEVAIARERLSRLMYIAEKVSSTPLVPKFTKIKIPTQLSGSVALSPNGKDLALVSDKKLWKIPLSGNLGPDIPGTPVELNTGDIEVEWSGLDWSKDGKWIAFNDLPKNNEKGELTENQSIYIVPSSGGTPNKVIENYRSGRVVNYQIGLSPEGKNIAFSSIEKNKQHIFSTSVDNIVPRQLVEMEAREPIFSPDGKYIAFVKDKNIGIGEGDLGLWVVRATGGTPHELADAGKASSPVWSPDGKMIAYLDRSGGNQIYIVPFSENGVSSEKVISIDAPEGTDGVKLLAGWTPDNKIGALITSKQEFGLYTLPANGGQAAKILHNCYAVQPRWSRNGEQIYYVATPEEGERRSYRRFLASVSASGGKGKPLKTKIKGESIKQFSFQSGNRVSPDGKWIVTSTWTPADTNSINVHWPTSKIWKVSVDGEDAIQVTNTPGNFADKSPCWSADGKKIAFIQTELIKGKMDFFGDSRIYIVDSNGGEPELLDPNPYDFANNMIWSPDGKMIAYLAVEKEEPQVPVIKIIDVRSRNIKTTLDFPNTIITINTELVWSPDSKRIAFNDEDSNVIKVMDIDDGSIENIETGLVDVGIFHLDWSPDGERFVFGGMKGGEAEFWFLENFLPLENLAQIKEKEVTPKRMTLQKVKLDNVYYDGHAVSPDGKFLTYSGEKDNLAIHEILTGKTRLLTNAKWYELVQFYMGSVVSPNSKQIAYGWYKNNFEIRLVNVDNPQPKVLYANKGEDVYPCAWSPDGKTVYAKSYLNKTGQCRILAISVSDGEVQVLKTFDMFYWLQLSVSHDNQFIAYHYPNIKNGKIANTDIYLISTDGKNETKLFEHPADDEILGWFPDKNQLLFKSNRSGTWDAWIVDVENGKIAGEPWRVLAEIGVNASQMGFTKNGTFYYSLLTRKFDGFISSFDQKNGELKSELTKPLLGSIRDAKWSPDGKSLALMKEIRNGRPIFIIDAATGEERMLSDRFNARHMLWLQDSKKLLILGNDEQRESEKDYSGGMYTIDVQSGEVAEILSFSDYRRNDWEIGLKVAQMLAQGNNDQKSIYYLKKGQLINRALVAGQEKIILENKSLKSNNYTLDLSPDGENLLFCNEKQTSIIPITGGKLIPLNKVVTTTSGPSNGNGAVWSPDGSYIFFTENKGEDASVVWRVSADGENPKEVWQSRFPISSLSIHPDGQKIVIITLNQGVEIWKVENFLPNKDPNVKQN